MRILQMCKKFPYPLKDGESIAVTYLAKAMNELGCDVTLLAMNTSKHYFDTNNLPDSFNHYESIYFTEIDNRINSVSAFLNLFSSDSYHISRFISKSFEKVLIQLLQSREFDIIQLESLYLAPYIDVIRKYSNAVLCMRAHNVEFEIWERIAKNTANPVKKWYVDHLAVKLKNFEVSKLKEYDLLAPISERDANIFKELGYNNKMQVIPIGIDNRDYMADDASFQKELSISFIGSLDWIPNLEGVEYFLSEIWPELSTKYPKLKLHIAGRNTPQKLLDRNIQNVVFEGEVSNAKDFINKHSIMLVPILSGSGMRAKILEGMALGKVVLTTSLGLEGISAKNKEHVLIADTKAEYIKCIEYCYAHKNELKEIGQRAQVFISDRYDNLQLAKHLIDAYGKPKLEPVM